MTQSFIAFCFAFLLFPAWVLCNPPSSRPSSQPQRTFLPLKLTLQPNRRYVLSYEQHTLIQQTAFGADTKVIQSQRTEFALQLHTKSTPQRMLLQVTYQRISSSQRIDRDRETFDSQRPPKQIPPHAYFLAQLPKRSFLVEFSPQGLPQRVLGLSGLVRALQQSISKHPAHHLFSKEARQSMHDRIRQQYGPKQMLRLVDDLFGYLPGASPSRTLTQWQRRVRSPMYAMQQDATWTLTHPSPRSLRLALQAKLHTPRNGVTPFGIGMTLQMQYNIKGKRSGSLLLSPVTKLPLKGQLQTEIAGQILYRPHRHTSGGRSWPLFLQITTIYKYLPPR